MGKSRVKGIVVEIGGDTVGLNKALDGTNKKINSTQAELKDVQRLLKLDPTNTNLLEQRQRILARAIEETGDKLKTLETANEQVAKTADNYDAWKAAYDPIQEEITTTSKKLSELKQQQQDMDDAGENTSDAYRELSEQVQSTAKELQNLRNAAKAVSDEFGNPVSPEQYDALQREIVETKAQLQDFERKAENAAAGLLDIDEKPVKNVEDAARKAADALDEAGDEASSFGDMLKAEMISDAAGNIVESLKDVAEETKEYRKIMGSLEVSSQKAGYTADETAEAYQHLYGVLGDDQTAATTTANLQALKLSQEQLTELINGTVGAWAEYGDSIPIDGLSEAINETVKTGKVTGNLADVLNWGAKEGENYGVAMREATEANEEWNQLVADAETAEDFFNLALSECTTEAERANLILQMLADQGLTESGTAWQQNNASLVESNEAQARMTEQLAQFSEIIEPVFTRVINLVADALEWFNSLDSDTQAFILTVVALVAALGPIVSGVTGVIGIFQSMGSILNFVEAVAIAGLAAAIIALVALIAVYGDQIQEALQHLDDFLQGVFLTDWTEVFGPGLGGALNGFFSFLKAIWDSVYQIFNGVIDFIRGVFTGDWERVWTGVASILKGIFDGLGNLLKSPINAIIASINGIFDAWNGVADMLNGIPGFDLGYAERLPYLADGGDVIKGRAVVGEAGPELLTVAGGHTIVQPLTNNTSTRTTNLGGVNLYVYGAPGQDEEELADIMMDKLQRECDSKEAGL